jgi:hypothetical protein
MPHIEHSAGHSFMVTGQINKVDSSGGNCPKLSGTDLVTRSGTRTDRATETRTQRQTERTGGERLAVSHYLIGKG